MNRRLGQQESLGSYPDEQASQRRLHRVRRRVVEAVSENQWLLPVAGVVAGVLLALVLGRAGGSPDPDLWAVTAGGARSGLISALSILFAGLSIVLALASVTVQNVVGRFSLRMLRIYLRNAWDKAVIAAFAMAATFILVEWYLLRALPPDALAPVSGVLMSALLLFFSGAMMIWVYRRPHQLATGRPHGAPRRQAHPSRRPLNGEGAPRGHAGSTAVCFSRRHPALRSNCPILGRKRAMRWQS